MPEAEPTLLFVYGTLRRGGDNDIARIAPDAKWVRAARVRGRLYDVNGRWPALVLDPQAGWVAGEIYAVPLHEWPALDALEDPVTPQHPDGAYFKVTTLVEGVDGNLSKVTVYTANPATTPLVRLIASGDWIDCAATLFAASSGRTPAGATSAASGEPRPENFSTR